MNLEVLAEIQEFFAPPEQIKSKHRTYLRWDKGIEYVEVQIPGTKIGKLREKRTWVFSNFIFPYKVKNGRALYKHVTCAYEYSKLRLELLLRELNR